MILFPLRLLKIQLLFSLTVALMCLEIVDLKFFEQAWGAFEQKKLKALWLQTHPLSIKACNRHLYCEKGKLKFCFQENHCQNIFHCGQYCQIFQQEELVFLEIFSYGRIFRYKYLSCDDHNDRFTYSQHQ